MCVLNTWNTWKCFDETGTTPAGGAHKQNEEEPVETEVSC